MRVIPLLFFLTAFLSTGLSQDSNDGEGSTTLGGHRNPGYEMDSATRRFLDSDDGVGGGSPAGATTPSRSESPRKSKMV
ncbi:hypothetical protein L596_019892 [Steinernema carpocapsae]|uniref:Uncharacterized protein n=1 Tax=Steinernema carpocapsae TaxID=34508 RepID=A0A4U5MSS3_STECR|nr:hypothetical protein L596_019892 [Steinernema carpocapsae]